MIVVNVIYLRQLIQRVISFFEDLALRRPDDDSNLLTVEISEYLKEIHYPITEK